MRIGSIENGIGIKTPGIGIGIASHVNEIEFFKTVSAELTSLSTIPKSLNRRDHDLSCN